MKNKRIIKLLAPILGIISFAITIETLELPVYADDNIVQTDTLYNESGNTTEYKDYSMKIDKSVIQNGIKINLEKLIISNHELEATIKAESETSFDENKRLNILSEVTFGNIDHRSIDLSQSYINNKTLLIKLNCENYEEEYPEKGKIRFDLVIPEYKINVGIDTSVDFSEFFKNKIEKDIYSKVPELDLLLNRLECNNIGTIIKHKEAVSDFDDEKSDSKSYIFSTMLLKAGNKMYNMKSGGSLTDNDWKSGIYKSEAATYDRIKDSQTISIIPIVYDMSFNDVNKMQQKKKGCYQQQNLSKRIVDNVSYLQYFDFCDTSKGEIYNTERNENTVKVYCKGNSEKASLLMASNMNLRYDFEYNLNYQKEKYTSFYKDPNDKFGYIVEFSNVEKDKGVFLDLTHDIDNIDSYKIGNEITLY